MTDRTVSFRLISSPDPLPPPPEAIPSPSVHWRKAYFDDLSDAALPCSSGHLGDTAVRKELWEAKALLDPLPDYVYRNARNEVFPLAVGGAQGSHTFYNRAGHKLNEVMEVTDIWRMFLRSAGHSGTSGSAAPLSTPAPTATSAPADGAEKGDTKEGIANEEEAKIGANKEDTNKKEEEEEKRTDTSTAEPLLLPRRGGSNKFNAKERVAFIDLCGGPGSFAQAIFGAYPKKSKVTLVGYGITLKDPNMVDKHSNASDGWYPNLIENKNFHPTFGVDGEGDIYKMSNIHSVGSQTEGMPMLLAVADGGFEVPDADANFQEPISMRLAFCQWHAALCVLQPGGSFVLKLFDTFSPIMRSMLYLTTKLFDSTYIVKPKHSRAVNSERYLAAKGFRGVPSKAWAAYLEGLHKTAFSDDSMPASLIPFEWVLEGNTRASTNDNTDNPNDKPKSEAPTEAGGAAPDVVVASSAITSSSSSSSAGGLFESSVVAMNKAIAQNQINALKKVMASPTVQKYLGQDTEKDVASKEETAVNADKVPPVVGEKRAREVEGKEEEEGGPNAVALAADAEDADVGGDFATFV